jgi:gamma-glutamylcyclotransferase (GGCT)/AIG2-like uncharacterized protein YtfP
MKTDREVKFLFVYGTLRNDAKNSMYHLLARNSTFIGDATYQGKLYLVEDYPAAVPSHNPADSVLGEVYSVHNFNYVLPQLDEYEECSTRFPKPTEYVRRIESVTLKTSGISILCIIYIYNWPIEHLKEIPSGNFFDVDLK